MLGDYGDVYVLDWGLARVVGEAITEVVTDDIDSLDVKSGDILGTPGYMAPEQLQRVGDTGRPADIYALGSILFEILAGESLHPRGPTAIVEHRRQRSGHVAREAPPRSRGATRARRALRRRCSRWIRRRGRPRAASPIACRRSSTVIATSRAARRWPSISCGARARDERRPPRRRDARRRSRARARSRVDGRRRDRHDADARAAERRRRRAARSAARSPTTAGVRKHARTAIARVPRARVVPADRVLERRPQAGTSCSACSSSSIVMAVARAVGSSRAAAALARVHDPLRARQRRPAGAADAHGGPVHVRAALSCVIDDESLMAYPRSSTRSWILIVDDGRSASSRRSASRCMAC